MSLFAEITLLQVGILWLWAIAACAPWHKFLRGPWLRVALHFKYAAWLIGVYWLAALFVHEFVAVVIAGAVALGALEEASDAEKAIMMPGELIVVLSSKVTPIARAFPRLRPSHRAISDRRED